MEGPITGFLPLDWALLAMSLFNATLLAWLGSIILLHAERRTWPLWLTNQACLLGSLFFAAHLALLVHGLEGDSPEMDLWWQAAWTPVGLLPLAWYVMMAWYSGLWEKAPSAMAARHRIWFKVAVAVAAVLCALTLVANPLPTYSEAWHLKPAETPVVAGVPILVWVYLGYCLLCFGLSLDALLRPGATTRPGGEVARRRARPWLLSATGLLLLVGLLVAWIIVWILLNVGTPRVFHIVAYGGLVFDFAISGLIMLAILCLGAAVTAYEIFTGRAVPRYGLRRDWVQAVVLAAAYSALVALSLSVGLRATYALLLTALLLAVAHAVSGWRMQVERERHLAQLRPFVASQHSYESLLPQDAGRQPAVDAGQPFRAMCTQVLGVRCAYLMPVGPLAPLVKVPLVYPAGRRAPATMPAELLTQLDSPTSLGAPVDRDTYGGASWAVPLWSERGLIGVLLLGEKRDGGMVTQEELEIARAACERLLDSCASAEIGRRLMALQRQRMAESQVIDQRTRRTLHDEILPQLHATMLDLSGRVPAEAAEPLRQLAGVHKQISDLLHQLPSGGLAEVAELGPLDALRQTVTDEFEGAFTEVRWRITDEAQAAAKGLPPLTQEVLFYAAREALRNAARHGRGDEGGAPLCLDLGAAVTRAHPGELRVTVADDGVGLTGGAVETRGTGQGLALHSTMMAVVGGSLAVESPTAGGTRVVLTAPTAALDGE